MAATPSGHRAIAASQTITCSIAGFLATSANSVNYDHSAGSCTLTGNNISTATDDVYDVFFVNQNGGAEQFLVGTGGAFSNSAHNGCTIGSFSAAAGVVCASSRNGTATETATVTIDGPNGGTIRMTINYAVAGEGSFTYTSASVTITTPDANVTPSAAARQAVLASASRSQSVVIGQNFSARVASVAGTTPPSGPVLNREPVGAGAPGAANLAFAGTAERQVRPSFTFDEAEVSSRSHGGGLREMALFASFNTSQLAALAPDANEPAGGPQRRTVLSGERRLTLWGHGSFTDVENTRNRAGQDNRFDGDVWGYNLGADYRTEAGLVAGLSVGYSRTDITTIFESGSYGEDAWTVSPYLIYRPTDMLTFSAIGGFGMGDVERERDAGITGNTDSTTWFLQMDARHAFTPIPDTSLRLTAGLGTLLSRAVLDGYTESDGSIVDTSTADTVRLQPSGELAYTVAIQETVYTPYLKASYLHDFTDETNGDAGAFDLSGGVRIASGATGLAGLIEARRLVGREDYREFGFSGLIAYGFSLDGLGYRPAGIASPYLRSDLSRDGSPILATGLNYTSQDGMVSGKLDLTRDIERRTERAMLYLRLLY